jgi:hypothetical protein
MQTISREECSYYIIDLRILQAVESSNARHIHLP